MAKQRIMQRFARWHIWAGWLVGFPVLMWTVTGLVMVARPIEEAVMSIEGLQQVTSTSQEGVVSVVLTFQVDQPISDIVQGIQSALSNAEVHLPADMPTISGEASEQPTVEFHDSATPVATPSRSGTTTSTFMIGSRMTGFAFCAASWKA